MKKNIPSETMIMADKHSFLADLNPLQKISSYKSKTGVEPYLGFNDNFIGRTKHRFRMTKSIHTSKRVLLIEDDDLIREIISELLSINKYEVTIAINGVEGLQRAKEHTPDIILCDIMMPEMNGIELIQHIKKDPALKDVPFLFMSARSRQEDEQHGLQAGADGYLFKPFSNAVLLEKIDALLKEKP